MLGWWRNRRRRNQLAADISNWIARHGFYARRLARQRSIDAYLLGDLAEQERWGRIRESIPEIDEIVDPEDSDPEDWRLTSPPAGSGELGAGPPPPSARGAYPGKGRKLP
jgi:hypothetical protein